MKTICLTGGAGFFGSLLAERLLADGYQCVSIDLQRHESNHPNLIAMQDDIRDEKRMHEIFRGHKFDAVIHCAAILAHAVKDEQFLWSSNVDGTRVVADMARKYHVPTVVFTSSNCLWGESVGRTIREDEPPNPVELYGQSKLAGERILAEYGNDFNSIIIRCPTIIDSGRLGLLSILFEFIDEGRRVWTVGRGDNKYQFIYAQDLADACIKAIGHEQTDTFHIGSDNVKSLHDVFTYVIAQSGSRSKLSPLPKGPSLFGMKVAHMLKVSPLGPYHYKMIAEDFEFDTTKIKRSLDWRPTLTNEQMLWRAYEYYAQNRRAIEGRKNVSAHRQGASMGVIRLLKWVS